MNEFRLGDMIELNEEYGKDCEQQRTGQKGIVTSIGNSYIRVNMFSGLELLVMPHEMNLVPDIETANEIKHLEGRVKQLEAENARLRACFSAREVRELFDRAKKAEAESGEYKRLANRNARLMADTLNERLMQEEVIEAARAMRNSLSTQNVVAFDEALEKLDNI